MIKLEWNKEEMTQGRIKISKSKIILQSKGCHIISLILNKQNGHFALNTNQNYAQSIRLALKAANLVPVEVHVEVLEADGRIADQVKWACNIDPMAKWGEVNYGIIAMIKNSNKAGFLIQS